MRNEKQLLTNFDDRHHRRVSAAISLQKGIYHLFMLKRQPEMDVYAKVLRSYQCAFQLCLTNLLLDFDFSLNPMLKPRRLAPRLRRLCVDPDEPSREYLDPACVVTHSVFETENSAWKGFRSEHPLHSVARDALILCRRTVDARHSLLYRPFLVASGSDLLWNDCHLQKLIAGSPSTNDVEATYRNFILALWDWRAAEEWSRVAERFIRDIFMVYRDEHSNRPTETIVLSYARILNPNNDQLLGELRSYRNALLRLDDGARFSDVPLPEEWQVGKV